MDGIESYLPSLPDYIVGVYKGKNRDNEPQFDFADADKAFDSFSIYIPKREANAAKKKGFTNPLEPGQSVLLKKRRQRQGPGGTPEFEFALAEAEYRDEGIILEGELHDLYGERVLKVDGGDRPRFLPLSGELTRNCAFDNFRFGDRVQVVIPYDSDISNVCGHIDSLVISPEQTVSALSRYVMRSYGIKPDYPDEIAQEARAALESPARENLPRKDMRHVFFGTVDDENASVFDDALGMEDDPHLPGVKQLHIAFPDALGALPEHSPLFRQADEQIFSAFLAGEQKNLFPEEITEALSLAQNQDRKAVVYTFRINDAGEMVDRTGSVINDRTPAFARAEISRAWIRSRLRATYKGLDDFYDNRTALPDAEAQWASDILDAAEQARESALLDERNKITIDRDSYAPVVEQGELTGFINKRKTTARRMIETLMTLANAHSSQILNSAEAIENAREQGKTLFYVGRAQSELKTILPKTRQRLEKLGFEDLPENSDWSAQDIMEVLDKANSDERLQSAIDCFLPGVISPGFYTAFVPLPGLAHGGQFRHASAGQDFPLAQVSSPLWNGTCLINMRQVLAALELGEKCLPYEEEYHRDFAKRATDTYRQRREMQARDMDLQAKRSIMREAGRKPVKAVIKDVKRGPDGNDHLYLQIGGCICPVAFNLERQLPGEKKITKSGRLIHTGLPDRHQIGAEVTIIPDIDLESGRMSITEPPQKPPQEFRTNARDISRKNENRGVWARIASVHKDGVWLEFEGEKIKGMKIKDYFYKATGPVIQDRFKIEDKKSGKVLSVNERLYVSVTLDPDTRAVKSLNIKSDKTVNKLLAQAGVQRAEAPPRELCPHNP